ncbi:MAG: protein-disulfide reductase DsbD N-terminal domain-containing protein [Pyrinomonadaceae bacterium]|nr:protein-disulfide reductase DsbD N-terminal domain-containing protein [Pyrinomonadaceae bacterium]
MKSTNLRRFTQFLVITSVLSFPATFAATPSPQSAPNIDVSGSTSVDTVRRGRSVQAVVVMNIPSGFHVHSNRPLEKFLIATQLQVETANGVRAGPVIYPRALLRSLKFSKSKVAVFEGRTTMRFNVTVPANFGSDSTEVKARLRYQSCSDEVCFPPQTREVTIPIRIKG